MVNIEHMFTIPLVRLSARDWDRKKQQVRKFMSQTLIKNGNADPCRMLDTDYGTLDQEYIDWHREKVHEIFSDELSEFTRIINANGYEITGSWFGRAQRGQAHLAHSHGTAGYSAICYVDYSPQHHQSTIFISPFRNFLDGSDLCHQPQDIKEGDIVFFPSSIMHMSPVNNNDMPRTVLAWDMHMLLQHPEAADS